MKLKLGGIIIAVLILIPLGVRAQTDSSAGSTGSPQVLILSLQKQVLQLLTQIQALQKEVAELKTETGIQSSPFSSPFTPISPISESDLPEFTRSLSLGTRGDDVRKLQEFLARDKEIYPEGLATGFYGPKTVEAVKKWQRKNNLDVVGIVGPKTIARFRELGQGVVRGLMEQGTPSGMVPPGLMMAPGIQRQMATSTSSGQATTTPVVMPPAMATTTPVMATTTPAIPAEPATPAVPGITSAVPATPATPAQPASTSSTASNELKVTYPNGGETWYKGNTYTITWQNPFQNGFTGDTSYRWVVGLKRGNTSYGGDSITTVPVTQSSIVWNQWTFPDPNVSVWTGQTAPLPDASDYKAFVSLLDLCASQVGGVCPSANISIIPAGGIDYSDGYFTATSTPPITTSAGTAPTISNVQTTNITSNTAVIIWNTDRPTDTQVEYGLNNLYGLRTTLDNSLVTSHSANLTGLNPATTYHYRIKSKDTSGYYATMNDYTFTTLSSGTSTATATTTTSTNDTTPPSAPTNLSATATYSTAYSTWQIMLSWTAATDNVGVVGYKIYRNNTLIASDPYSPLASSPAYADIGSLAAGSSYSYTVAAYDAAGNISALSNSVSATTQSASADTTATTTSAILDSLSGLLIKLLELLRK